MTTEELKAWAQAWIRHQVDDLPVALQDEVAAAVLALIAERDAAQDGMRQFVERAAKERTRAEAAEGKLAEAERSQRAWKDEALTLRGAEARVEALEKALRDAKNELGVPQPGYPAPVANACAIIDAALARKEGP